MMKRFQWVHLVLRVSLSKLTISSIMFIKKIVSRYQLPFIKTRKHPFPFTDSTEFSPILQEIQEYTGVLTPSQPPVVTISLFSASISLLLFCYIYLFSLFLDYTYEQ